MFSFLVLDVFMVPGLREALFLLSTIYYIIYPVLFEYRPYGCRRVPEGAFAICPCMEYTLVNKCEERKITK